MSTILTFFVLLSLSTTAIMAQSESQLTQFAKKGSEFAADLYLKMTEGKDGENIIFSPFSIQTCLALAYSAAGGVTSMELAKGLRLVSNDRSEVANSFSNILDLYKSNPLLKIANKIYVKTGYELNPGFNEIATKKFHSEAENLDFAKSVASAKTINSWVEEKTNNKIKDLISSDSLDGDTRAVLVNAIYFKGLWKTKFEKQATRKDDFWISETESVKVDMMFSNEKFKYGEFPDLDATAVELPYKDSNLSMVVILPNSKTGLKNLESKLSQINLVDMTKKMYKTELNLKLPRFKIEFSTDLEEPLRKMGMNSMFDNADFSNLLKVSEDIKISKVVHKAFIEVNEEGAEAAAATGVSFVRFSMKVIKYLHANYPFLYLIKDARSNMYFIGKFVKP